MYKPKYPFFNNSIFNNPIFPRKNITNNINKYHNPYITHSQTPKNYKNVVQHPPQNHNHSNYNSNYTNNTTSSQSPNQPENTLYENNDTILFEIFGIKIYFDDLLILCILLFLYEEKIQDEYLFIALILLLFN